jgi:uncharacterized protein (DUF362 family)
MITRRRLIQLGATAAALSACRRRHPNPATVTDARIPIPPPPPIADHRAALAAALATAGGLDFIRRGDRVLLKVNTNSGDPYPYSTSPDVVRWLAEELHDRGAHVTVGDRSFWGDGDTRGNLERNGIARATREAGATLAVFEDDGDWVAVDDALVPHWRPPVHLPRVAVLADHVFNLACAKTHFITGCTLGLKNLLGLVRARDRRRDGNLYVHHDELIHHQIADINRAIAPRLTVVDGWRALVSGGPTPGSGARPTIVDTGVVLAGRDRIAVDLAAIELLQRHAPASEAIHATTPAEHPTIVAARRALRGDVRHGG